MANAITAGADPQAYEFLLNREQLPLGYHDYDENDEIYIMDDGGLSIMFECKPYGGLGAESGLVTALSSMPEGAAIQFILYPSPDITPQVDFWKTNKTTSHGLYPVIRDNYAEFIERKTKEPLGGNMRTPVSNYKLIVALSVGGRNEVFSLFDTIGGIMRGGDNKKDSKREYRQRYAKLIDLKSRLSSALFSANLFPKPLRPDTLIRFVYGIFNPNHDFRRIPKWKGSGDIAENCIANDTVIEVRDDHIKFDGRYARSMSVKDYSYDWHCAFADQLIGNAFGSPIMEGAVLYCLNVINIGKKGIGKVKRKSQIILSQNLPDHLFPLLGMKKRDLAMANRELEKGKEVFHVNLAVMPMAESYEKLNNLSGQVQAYYQRLGFALEEDRYITLPVLLSMLPGNYDERFKDDLKRGVVVFMENAVDLAPTAADWQGNTEKPEIFLFTPRGQLFSFDLFVSNTNYNAFVIGTSGAGKSVLMQNIALNYLMSGNKVSIIDIGGSYENFCNTLDGQYIDVKPDTPICLNPWTDITNDKIFNDFSEFLADWYWMMGSPQDFKLTQEHEKFVKSWLSMALKRTYLEYGNKSSVDTVVECLKACVMENSDTIDGRISDFIQVLTLYMSGGIYGAFFNGDSQIELHNNLVVLETGTMENIPALRDPVIMILFHHISKSIYLSSSMEKQIVMIDEAHKFLGNYRVDVFVEQAYRRFRKHLASMIIGTQGYEDLVGEVRSRAGRVIIDNSAFQIFMKQSPSSSEKLKNSVNHNFDDYEKAMIESIKSIRGEYSEGIMIHENLKIKFRLILDGFMKRLFFTTPEMRVYIRGKVKEGVSFIDAVKSIPDEMVR